jgi:hypothetical protein
MPNFAAFCSKNSLFVTKSILFFRQSMGTQKFGSDFIGLFRTMKLHLTKGSAKQANEFREGCHDPIFKTLFVQKSLYMV